MSIARAEASAIGDEIRALEAALARKQTEEREKVCACVCACAC